MRQPLRRVESEPGQSRDRLAASQYMRGAEYGIVEPKGRRGELQRVLGKRLAGREHDHPLRSRLFGGLDRRKPRRQAAGSGIVRKLDVPNFSETSAPRQAVRDGSGKGNDGKGPSGFGRATHSIACRDVKHRRIDVLITVPTAVIVVVDGERPGDVAAGIDAELEVGPLDLVAVAELPGEMKQRLTIKESFDAGVAGFRPVDAKDEVQPPVMRDVRHLVEDIAFVGVRRGDARKCAGEAQRPVEIAHGQRRLARWVAQLRLVMPLGEHHANPGRRLELAGQPG